MKQEKQEKKEWVTPDIFKLCFENNEGKEYFNPAETTTTQASAGPS